ncbi:DUF6471 domain-containing protein [Mesorhizobium sp. LSJC255A00]
MAGKDDPQTVEYETKAKNLLKSELKRKGVTYAQLAENWRLWTFTKPSVI